MPPTPWDWQVAVLDAYDEALRDVLEIPPLESEASGAQRVVRCLFKPSLHPECSISLIDRDGTAKMTMRVPDRSVWSCIYARDGRKAANPVTDWVKPTVSTEHVVLPADIAASWRGTVDAIECTVFPQDESVLGLDRMNVDVLLWRPGSERSFNCWICNAMKADGRHLLVLSVLETAVNIATWDQSIAGLKNIRSYLDN